MWRKNGEIFISEHTATEIIDDPGRRKAIVIVIRDITERKHAELKLRDYHEHLEELVRERTAKLMKAVAEAKQLNYQLQQEIIIRKQTEKTLQFKNAILSTQQETALDGILMIDRQGKLISCNQRFREMWKLPGALPEAGADDLILQSFLEKLPKADEFRKRMQRTPAKRPTMS